MTGTSETLQKEPSQSLTTSSHRVRCQALFHLQVHLLSFFFLLFLRRPPVASFCFISFPSSSFYFFLPTLHGMADSQVQAPCAHGIACSDDDLLHCLALLAKEFQRQSTARAEDCHAEPSRSCKLHDPRIEVARDPAHPLGCKCEAKPILFGQAL